MASLLPYILNELRDRSNDRNWEEPMQRRQRHWLNDVDDVLADYARPTPALWLHLPSGGSMPPSALTGHQRFLRRPQTLKEFEKLMKQSQPDNNGPLTINVDVQDYRPEELSVQVLKDEGCVVVEGRHEEKGEHSFVQHQFTRRYKLPSDVDPDTVTSRLSPDGILQVSAPRKEALPAPKDNVRQVSIVYSNQPALVKSDDRKADQDTESEKSKVGAEGDNNGQVLAA